MRRVTQLPIDRSVKVEFPGHGVFWLHEAGSGSDAAIAPLDHCDEDGNIKDLGTALFADSYAHVFGTVIKRYGKEIGMLSDLIIVSADDSVAATDAPPAAPLGSAGEPSPPGRDS